MRVAGLKAISTVVESSAILIQSKHPTNPQLVKTIRSRIKGWIGESPPIYTDLHRLLPDFYIYRRAKVYDVQV
jgi:ATP phosphoribosyltransferase